MNGTITKKVFVLITLISFTIACTGCYSYCEEEYYSDTVEHTGERRTAPHRRHVEIEFLTSILIFALLIATVVAGSHGYYSGGHSYHH